MPLPPTFFFHAATSLRQAYAAGPDKIADHLRTLIESSPEVAKASGCNEDVLKAIPMICSASVPQIIAGAGRPETWDALVGFCAHMAAALRVAAEAEPAPEPIRTGR